MLIFSTRRDDQQMIDRSSRKAAADLCVDRRSPALGAINLVIAKQIDVARPQDRSGQARLPHIARGAVTDPNPPRRKLVPGPVERVGAQIGEWVGAVIFIASTEKEARCGQRQLGHRRPSGRAANGVADKTIAVAVAVEAVDALGLAVPIGDRHPNPIITIGCRRSRAPKAEAARLDCPASAGREGIRAIDRNYAPNCLRSPQRRLWPAHFLDPAGDVGVEQFEPRLIACRRVIGADAVDEQQGVIGLGTADADLGE